MDRNLVFMEIAAASAGPILDEMLGHCESCVRYDECWAIGPHQTECMYYEPSEPPQRGAL